MEADNVFFTSDTHFSHKNIIRYENRGKLSSYMGAEVTKPYKNTDGMNADIIESWNSVVDNDAIIFHLGDFCFGNKEEWLSILSQLNGKEIHLVTGNHDKTAKQMSDHFTSISNFKEITLTFADEKIPVTLSHYPMVVWNRSHYGAWQLFGHVHKMFKFNPHSLRSLNVGWDIWNSPISANYIAELFYKQFVMALVIPLPNSNLVRTIL